MKVLIPEDIAPKGKEYLLSQGYELTVGVDTDVETLKSVIGDYDALICRNAQYPREVIEAGKKLKVIARHGVGVDNIDVRAAEEHGIWVVNGPGSNTQSVAEYTMTLICMLSTQVMQIQKHTREGDWSYRKKAKRRDLEGAVLGILGFGNIGRAVARIATRGFGMKVVTCAYQMEEVPMENVEYVDTLEEIASAADYLSVNLPLTAQTQGLVNKELLSHMKKSAYLVNCARGEVCDVDDLLEALENGTIAGAALDVYPEEPLPLSSPLFQCENLILSQHFAGFSETSLENMSYLAAQGVWEVLSGKAPTFPVNDPLHRGSNKNEGEEKQ